jgi:hypothetical protein
VNWKIEHRRNTRDLIGRARNVREFPDLHAKLLRTAARLRWESAHGDVGNQHCGRCDRTLVWDGWMYVGKDGKGSICPAGGNHVPHGFIPLAPRRQRNRARTTGR